MFSGVGWGEIFVILVAAVIIFGPDKLPKVASDLAKTLRMVRNWAQRARNELQDELPPELRDFDVSTLNPKTFVRKVLLEDDPLGVDDAEENGSARKSASSRSGSRQLAPGEPAPYDVDAT